MICNERRALEWRGRTNVTDVKTSSYFAAVSMDFDCSPQTCELSALYGYWGFRLELQQIQPTERWFAGADSTCIQKFNAVEILRLFLNKVQIFRVATARRITE